MSVLLSLRRSVCASVSASAARLSCSVFMSSKTPPEYPLAEVIERKQRQEYLDGAMREQNPAEEIEREPRQEYLDAIEKRVDGERLKQLQDAFDEKFKRRRGLVDEDEFGLKEEKDGTKDVVSEEGKSSDDDAKK